MSLFIVLLSQHLILLCISDFICFFILEALTLTYMLIFAAVNDLKKYQQVYKGSKHAVEDLMSFAFNSGSDIVFISTLGLLRRFSSSKYILRFFQVSNSPMFFIVQYFPFIFQRLVTTLFSFVHDQL